MSSVKAEINDYQRRISMNTDKIFADTKGIAEELNHTDLSNLVLITRDYLEPYLRFVSENKDLYQVAFPMCIGDIILPIT